VPVSDEFLTAGLKITGHFEDADDPLAAVSGNFDAQGISLGVLQWNIGSNSLQPIVRAIGKTATTTPMPNYGADLWRACNSTVAQGLAIVRAWQPNNKLPKACYRELKAFVRDAPFQTRQMDVARKVGNTAWNTALDWAEKRGRPDVSKREFCWFYDIYTQNGSLKSLTVKKVRDFIANHGAESADDLICDWLAARSDDARGAIDSRKNAKLWRGAVPDDDLFLFVASYLRIQESNPLWQSDAMNRKGTIALGSGWAHKEKHDLTPITG
jgi:hypothetical protein